MSQNLTRHVFGHLPSRGPDGSPGRILQGVLRAKPAGGARGPAGLSQALVSKHLKLLTIAGVVQRRPEGSLVFYEVIDKAVLKLLGQAEMLLLATRRHQLS